MLNKKSMFINLIILSLLFPYHFQMLSWMDGSKVLIQKWHFQPFFTPFDALGGGGGNENFSPSKKPWTKFYLHWYVTSYKKSEKINAQFSRYSQMNGRKCHFCQFWPPGGGTRFFPKKKPWTKCYLHWYVTSCKKLEIIHEWFLTYSQENGQKGHFGPFLAPGGATRFFQQKSLWQNFTLMGM